MLLVITSGRRVPDSWSSPNCICPHPSQVLIGFRGGLYFPKLNVHKMLLPALPFFGWVLGVAFLAHICHNNYNTLAGCVSAERSIFMDYLTSNSQLLMEKSMGYLWTKQAAILDNIANAETPKYKAKVVTFEESIRAQL